MVVYGVYRNMKFGFLNIRFDFQLRQKKERQIVARHSSFQSPRQTARYWKLIARSSKSKQHDLYKQKSKSDFLLYAWAAYKIKMLFCLIVLVSV